MDELREEMSTVMHLGMRYFGLEAAAVTEVADDVLVVHARRREADERFFDAGPPGLCSRGVLAIHDSSSGWDHGRRLRAVGAGAYIGAPIQIRGRTVALLELTGAVARTPFLQSDHDMIVSLTRWLACEIGDRLRIASSSTPAIEIAPRISGIRSITGTRASAERLAEASNDCAAEESAFEACPIADACDAALAAVFDQAEVKGVQLSSTVAARCKTIDCVDGPRLQQMLETLLTNAVRLCEPGGRAGIEVLDEPETEAMAFTVWDDSPALSEHECARLLSPSSEPDATMSQSRLGVELTLIQKLVDLHGGSLAIQSATTGNRFTLRLPNHGDELPSSSRSSWQNLFIVVIDPKAALAQTVTPFLLDRGHRVYVATSYEQGVSFTREYRPDVVLIDARADDPSALFAIRSIRASDSSEMACTPVVAACGLLLPGYAERCKAAGVTELFERPMRTREMVAIVEEHGPYAKAC